VTVREELVKHRKAVGLSQDQFAAAIGVDRTTVGRWERNETTPQAGFLPRMAKVLQVGQPELEQLLSPLPDAPVLVASGGDLGDLDDMIRRDFLRLLTLAGSMSLLPPGSGTPDDQFGDYEKMNGHLWQVYQLARSKSAILPMVRDQLTVLSSEFSGVRSSRRMCRLSADLFQLAGEVHFDMNRYTDAVQCYTLAMQVSREADEYDLWSCALIRHAFVYLYKRRYAEASALLAMADRAAARGDRSLSTRHWVAAVQAQAFAGLKDLDGCERAMDRADGVLTLGEGSSNGGWLRFDGSRLAEERGARYVEFGRLGLAENALVEALKQPPLAVGSSFRRRGSVLVDLAIVGIRRHDVEAVLTHGHESVALAQRSRSGYLARRLQGLRAELAPVAGDARFDELRQEIAALSV